MTPRVPWTPIDVIQLLFAWIVALILGQLAYEVLVPPKVEGQHEVAQGNKTLVVKFLPSNRYNGETDNGTFRFAGEYPAQDRHTLILSPHKSDTIRTVTFKGTERDRVGLITINIIFVQCSAIVLIAVLLLKYRTKWGAAFGNSKDSFWTVSLAFTFGVGFLLPAYGLHSISHILIISLGGEPTTQEAVKMVSVSSSRIELILQALSVVILAPIAEELFFRGVIYTSIKQAGLPNLAIGFSAIFFAAIHGSWALMLPLIVLALILVWIYERTGSIIAPIVMHTTFNAVNFAMIKCLPPLTN